MRTLSVSTFLVCLLSGLGAFAQSAQDSAARARRARFNKTYELNPVTVQRNTAVNSVPTDRIDASDKSRETLTDYLQWNTPMFLRTYGSGIAMPAMRGAGANHTKVYWNGMPINSPMLGVADLNLFPSFVFDNAMLEYGQGSPSRYGGAFGGSLSLFTTQQNDTNLLGTFYKSAGSFGQMATAATLNLNRSDLKNRTAYYTTRLYARQAENDFSYRNTAKFGAPVERQQNAAMRQFGAAQEFYQPLSLGPIKQISGDLWIQNTARNLPGRMTLGPTGETQRDASIRAVVRLPVQVKEGNQINILGNNLSYSHELLDYRNPMTRLVSKSFFDRAQWVVWGSFAWKPNKPGKRPNIFLGHQLLADQAISTGYTGSRKQFREAAWVSYMQSFFPKLKWKEIGPYSTYRLALNMNARLEAVNYFRYMPIGSIGVKYILYYNQYHNYKSRYQQEANLEGNLGANANYPTLNDLYWQPGGNPGLRPETAVQRQLSFTARSMRADTGEFTLRLSGYSNIINGFIQWLPGDFGYWEAQNLRRVWARGGEAGAQYSRRLPGVFLTLSALYSYTRSSNTRSAGPGDSSVGKQLIYLPRHQFKTYAALQLAKTQLRAEYILCGTRRTPDDVLAAYGLVNLQVQRAFKLPPFTGKLQFRLNNLTDETYQVIPWYPMPGRWVEGSLILDLYKEVK